MGLALITRIPAAVVGVQRPAKGAGAAARPGGPPGRFWIGPGRRPGPALTTTVATAPARRAIPAVMSWPERRRRRSRPRNGSGRPRSWRASTSITGPATPAGPVQAARRRLLFRVVGRQVRMLDFPMPAPATDLPRHLLRASSTISTISIINSSSSSSRLCTGKVVLLRLGSTQRMMLPGDRHLLRLRCPQLKATQALQVQVKDIHSSLKVNLSLCRVTPSRANIFIPPCTNSSRHLQVILPPAFLRPTSIFPKATPCHLMDITLKWHRIIRTKRQVRHQFRRKILARHLLRRIILALHQRRRTIPPRILRPTHPVDRQETAGDRRRVGDAPKKVVDSTAQSGAVWNTAKIASAAVTRMMKATNVRCPPDEQGHQAGRSRHHHLPTQKEAAVAIAVALPQLLMLVVFPKAIR